MLEDGNYQVISQVSSMDNIALALTSFDILVPLQPFGKFDVNSLISSLIPAGSVGIRSEFGWELFHILGSSAANIWDLPLGQMN